METRLTPVIRSELGEKNSFDVVEAGVETLHAVMLLEAARDCGSIM